MKKLYPLILLITLILVATACSRGGSNVFKEQALILRKTIESFVEYDDAGEEVYKDTAVSKYINTYNEKGLMEAVSSEEREIRRFTYQYDEKGSPTSISFGMLDEDMAFPIQNTYEGNVVKEAQVDVGPLAAEFGEDPNSWSAVACAAVNAVVEALENCVYYRDARITLLGSDVYCVRAGGITVEKCTLQPGYRLKYELHKNEDGTSWDQTTYSGSIDSFTRNEYDAMGRLSGYEVPGNMGLQKLTYTETKDAASGRTVYQASGKRIAMRYEFEKGKMVLRNYAMTSVGVNQTTTYTEDGQIATYEQYSDGHLRTRETYEYGHK